MKNKILIASDLDNTLLVSHRNRRDGDVCVEMYNGNEQTFMTKRSIELLRQVNKKIGFAPVTTRSLEQYRRIMWPEGCEPEYAVVSNGAILLNQGAIDEEWSQQIRLVVSACRDEMMAQYERLSLSKNFLRCHIVDDSYLFLYCNEDTDVKACAEDCCRHTMLDVEYLGRKIYLFPTGLNKGESLKRLKNFLGCEYTYAAGDSFIDVPMLNAADVSFAPEVIQCMTGANCLIQPKGTVFSEWVLEKIAIILDIYDAIS